MLVFKPILDSGLTDKQILFQLTRINSWISLNGKFANSYKSKINIDFRGLTNDVMKKLGYEPNTIVKNTIETDATIFQAENKCGVKYPYVSAPNELLLDTNLNPAQKVLLLILREVWLDKDGNQLLPYCQTETIFKQIPNYKHTRDYTNKLIIQLQEKGYISFDSIKNRGRVNVRIDFNGKLKDIKEELAKQVSAEDEIKEMVQPVKQIDDETSKLIKDMANEIATLKKQFKEQSNEIASLKETVKKLQEELNDQRRIERTNSERPSRVREIDRDSKEITEDSETVEQGRRSNDETIEQFDRPSTGSESDGWFPLRNDSGNSEQLDDMDSLFALIPEGGEYSSEEVEKVKAENPVRKQRKAECTADSFVNLANNIDFKLLMKDMKDDIQAEKEHRSNIWKSSKKDEFQEYIKELQKETKKNEIVEYIINTVNEPNSRILINSLDDIYYKLVMKVITKNKDRITNTYFKNASEFDIHHSTLQEFTGEVEEPSKEVKNF